MKILQTSIYDKVYFKDKIRIWTIGKLMSDRSSKINTHQMKDIPSMPILMRWIM